MGKKTTENRHVIFAQPENYSGPSKYYGKDGSITEIKDLAAQFYTFDDAKDWAKEQKIELTAATYIGLETFRIN